MKYTKISRKQFRKNIGYIFLGMLLCVGVFAPLVWMFFTSVMPEKDLTAHPLSLIPKSVTFKRYYDIFRVS